MKHSYYKSKNIRVLVIVFLFATLYGCSSSKELEGRWVRDNKRSDPKEYIITKKTVTISYWSGGVYTKPYKVFEKGKAYIVLEIGEQSKNKLISSKEFLRFDIVSENKIIVKGLGYTRRGLTTTPFTDLISSTWQSITELPRYRALDNRTKAKVFNKWSQDHLDNNKTFQELSPDVQSQVKQKYIDMGGIDSAMVNDVDKLKFPR